jgi:NAD(P)-dependent dehydrogenase (short-subunit alcohol dehydrogenase family)
MSSHSSPDPKRTIVVTGASSGLGVAIAVAFGELGWRVAVGARRVERLEDTALLVERAGGTCLPHALDVSNADSVDAFYAAVEGRFGVASAVVNNAGSSRPGLLQDIPPDALAHEVMVNLLGPMYMARRALPAMLERDEGGDIVFITSDASMHPRPQQAPYTATKAGLEGLSRALSMELEGTGIRSTIVRPGPTISEYATGWGAERITKLLEYWQQFGLQRHGGVMPAEAVARAVVLAVTTPPGVHLDTIEVQPEAPRGSGRS